MLREFKRVMTSSFGPRSELLHETEPGASLDTRGGLDRIPKWFGFPVATPVGLGVITVQSPRGHVTRHVAWTDSNITAPAIDRAGTNNLLSDLTIVMNLIVRLCLRFQAMS